MFLGVLLTTFTLWLIIQHYRRISRLPPGPFSLPILGNVPFIFYQAWRCGGVVPLLNKFRKTYGNIFTIWIGPIPHVSITDFETSHEVFVKNSNKYADKSFSPIFSETRNGLGLIAVNGPMWQEVRRFSLQTFRNMGVGKELMELRIMNEFDSRCAELDEAAVNGIAEVSATDFFDLTIGSIINSILMGQRFSKNNSDEFLQLKNMIDISTKVLNPIDLMLPIWFLKRFLKNRYDLLLKAHGDVMDFLARDDVKRVEDVMSGRTHIDPDNPSDFVDCFILKMLQEGSDKQVYSIPCLKATLVDLWLAGQETTTTTLSSGFTQLLNHPEVMTKLREELRKVTGRGSRSLSLTDKNDTPYLNAVIAEIQRHASILNINFWKVNHELTTIGGHPIGAGALVSAQLSAIHSNDSVYKNPEKFDPERFMVDKDAAQRLIPFGLGKRACTGEALARAELYLIIGNLILRYECQPAGKTSDIDDAPFSFAKKPQPLQIRFVKISKK